MLSQHRPEYRQSANKHRHLRVEWRIAPAKRIDRSRRSPGRSTPEVVGPLLLSGDVWVFALDYSRSMQLIQIGEVRQKTVLDLVQEMAARQAAEIEQLKANTLNRATNRRSLRVRSRCNSDTSSSR